MKNVTRFNAAFEAMIHYAKHGIPVFPCHRRLPDGSCTCSKGNKCESAGKHPRTRNGVKDATTDLKVIEGWFKKWPDSNPAIRTGFESGIVVVDIDPRSGGNASLSDLQRAYGPLPETPCARTPSGGRHFFFKHPGKNFRVKNSQSKIAAGVDVRGEDGYVIAAPGSDEQPYVWEISLEIPLAPLPDFIPKQCTDIENTEAAQLHMPLPSLPSASATLLPLSALTYLTGNLQLVEEAIASTMPARVGERERLIWELVRTLKAIPVVNKLPLSESKPIVKHWHRRALPFIGTKPWEATWACFVRAWSNVKYSKGCGRWNDFIARAKLAPDPVCVLEYDSEPICLLVKVCRELQRSAGDEPFYISCRKAAEIVGESPNDAANILKMLLADNVIELAEESKGRKARRYRYIASD